MNKFRFMLEKMRTKYSDSIRHCLKTFSFFFKYCLQPFMSLAIKDSF